MDLASKVGAKQSFLTEEEKEKCKEAFDAFDKDSNGYIDSNELRVVLESKFEKVMGQHPTEEEIYRMKADVDNDGSQTISIINSI